MKAFNLIEFDNVQFENQPTMEGNVPIPENIDNEVYKDENRNSGVIVWSILVMAMIGYLIYEISHEDLRKSWREVAESE